MKTEEKLIEEICWVIHNWEEDRKLPPESRICKILSSALFSAKTTLPKGTPRRVFIQDLAASLNRKRILPNEKVEPFTQLGYEYMQI
jgi:hypothetical protein